MLEVTVDVAAGMRGGKFVGLCWTWIMLVAVGV